MQYLIPPWKHQLDAIELANRIPNLGLFFEMGTGKTGTAINILRYRYAREHRLMRTLILGPVIVMENWKREFAMHSKIKPQDIVILKGAGKKRLRVFEQATIDRRTMTLTQPRIILTNYEAMQMEDLVNLIKSWEPEILICDESHRLKNHASKRAKKVVQIADYCKHRYILTGTPILNSEMDVFNQFRILDGGKTFGKNFWVFRNQYFVDENSGWSNKPNHFAKYIAREDTYIELRDLIYKKALRVLKEECLDLPPFVRKTIEVPMGKEQMRLYKEMRDEYLTYIKDELHQIEKSPAVMAQVAITKALRLQQIASGYAKTEDGEEVQLKDNPRLEAISDLLDELTPNHKVIIWATFQVNYKQLSYLCKKKGIKYVELHGKVPKGKREENQNSFRSDPETRVIIANQGAAGIGINLVEASYSIYYSRNFSLEHDLQSEARNYRGGSERHKKVTRIDLVSPDTIDETVLEALARKQEISDVILDWKEKEL